MPAVIRALRHGEERLFLELHAQSIRGLAAGQYAPEVIDAWCVTPTEGNLASFIKNEDRELRLFAELGGRVVGLAALVREMERLALEHHLDHLELLSSINAEPFYAALGYQSEGCTVHNMRGQPMAAVKMLKRLR